MMNRISLWIEKPETAGTTVAVRLEESAIGEKAQRRAGAGVTQPTRAWDARYGHKTMSVPGPIPEFGIAIGVV